MVPLCPLLHFSIIELIVRSFLVALRTSHPSFSILGVVNFASFRSTLFGTVNPFRGSRVVRGQVEASRWPMYETWPMDCHVNVLERRGVTQQKGADVKVWSWDLCLYWFMSRKDINLLGGWKWKMEMMMIRLCTVCIVKGMARDQYSHSCKSDQHVVCQKILPCETAHAMKYQHHESCWMRVAHHPAIIYTPKFNIAPEKWWLEDYIPFGFR